MKAERQQKESQKAEPIQSKPERSHLSFEDNRSQTASQATLIQSIQKKENKTGLPDDLKTGVENLSGFSMDDVHVHYNSGKPAQLNALAYAQGPHIHIAPGREKHLPHEAWHVVQQKQGRAQPTLQLKDKVDMNDDATMEKEADAMGEKALQMKLESGGNNTYQKVSPFHSIVQMRPRKAAVDWRVTHLVREQNDSLFGDDTEQGWQEGELPVEEGELVRGQPIVVDDELIFMSRRGSNQENPEKRRADMTSELKYKWYNVLTVGDVNYKGQKVYIRSETIKFSEAEPREQRPIRTVEIPETDMLSKEISDRLFEIRKAWLDAAVKRRRRSIRQVKYKGEHGDLPEGLSSGWNWDQYDEGQDVAKDMANPDDRAYIDPQQSTNFTFSAFYEDDPHEVRIAFLVMEQWDQSLLREASDYEAEEEYFFYIRWLIGHPELKGGGSAVMKQAKEKASQWQQAIYVQVAYSAVEWYKRAGFEVVQVGEFREGEGYGDALLKYTPPRNS